MKKWGFGFGNAFRGLLYAIFHERNFRVHIVAYTTVIYFACVFGVERTEAAILALTAFCVMAAELVNTALEAVVDKLSPEKSPYAKIAKDCSAAAVLVLAMGAVLVAIALFWEPSGWQRVWEYIKENYGYLIIFAAFGTGFIYMKDKEHKG